MCVRTYTCSECGASKEHYGHRGQLPTRCAVCKKLRRKTRPEGFVAHIECVLCGKGFEANGSRGKLPRYCGAKCRNAGRTVESRDIACDFCATKFHGKPGRKWCDGCQNVFLNAKKHKCEWCDKLFRIKGGKCAGRFCSKKCSGKARSLAAQQSAMSSSSRDLKKLFSDIDKIIRASRRSRRIVQMVVAANERDLQRERDATCHTCGKRLANPFAGATKFCSRRCNPARRGSRKHTTRAKKRGLPRQYSITLQKVAERDAWVCAICQTPVDSGLHCQHRMAACIDHIVPLNMKQNTTHGHVWNNVQLAHRHCNESKGCTVACSSLLDSYSPRDAIRVRCIDQKLNRRSVRAHADQPNRNSQTGKPSTSHPQVG